MRTNLPKAPPRRDKAAGNPRRNPTRLDTQQAYHKMKQDLWRQLVRGELVCIPRESLGLWREAYRLIEQDLVEVKARSELPIYKTFKDGVQRLMGHSLTMWIRLKMDDHPEIDFQRIKKKVPKGHKFYLHHLNHEIEQDKTIIKGKTHIGDNGRRVWIAD